MPQEAADPTEEGTFIVMKRTYRNLHGNQDQGLMATSMCGHQYSSEIEVCIIVY